MFVIVKLKLMRMLCMVYSN